MFQNRFQHLICDYLLVWFHRSISIIFHLWILYLLLNSVLISISSWRLVHLFLVLTDVMHLWTQFQWFVNWQSKLTNWRLILIGDSHLQSWLKSICWNWFTLKNDLMWKCWVYWSLKLIAVDSQLVKRKVKINCFQWNFIWTMMPSLLDWEWKGFDCKWAGWLEMLILIWEECLLLPWIKIWITMKSIEKVRYHGWRLLTKTYFRWDVSGLMGSL